MDRVEFDAALAQAEYCIKECPNGAIYRKHMENQINALQKLLANANMNDINQINFIRGAIASFKEMPLVPQSIVRIKESVEQQAEKLIKAAEVNSAKRYEKDMEIHLIEKKEVVEETNES